jgi:xanthine phosphoribosyltransferase
MEALKERILRDGENLGRGILKVDSFINHQVDPTLMLEAGKELAAYFAPVGATKVLTAEISGIAPALMTALDMGVPVLYARKTKPVTMTDPVYVEASGQTIKALVRMIRHAKAQLVGIGALIEKAFEGGRAELETLGIPLHALVTITSMTDEQIVFAE